MKVLRIEELRIIQSQKINNVNNLLSTWLKRDIINDEQNIEITSDIKLLNYSHHNMSNFEKNFLKLFEKMDTTWYDDTERLLPQVLDRSGSGSSFGGIKISSNIHFFVETSEYGINIYCIDEEINKNTISIFTNTMKWFTEGMLNPDEALIKMNYMNLKQEIESSIEQGNDKSNQEEKNKLLKIKVKI